MINEKDVDVTGLQIDYATGNFYATVKKKGSNDFESVYLPYKNILDIESQDKISEYQSMLKDIDTALNAGRIDPSYALNYRESLMDDMYTIMSSLFEYTGGLNVNTDTGQKRMMAGDAETDTLNWDTEIE